VVTPVGSSNMPSEPIGAPSSPTTVRPIGSAMASPVSIATKSRGSNDPAPVPENSGVSSPEPPSVTVLMPTSSRTNTCVAPTATWQSHAGHETSAITSPGSPSNKPSHS